MHTSSVPRSNDPTHTSRSRVYAAEHNPEHMAHAVTRHGSHTRERTCVQNMFRGTSSITYRLSEGSRVTSPVKEKGSLNLYVNANFVN